MKNTKKIIALLVALIMVAGIAACARPTPEAPAPPAPPPAAPGAATPATPAAPGQPAPTEPDRPFTVCERGIPRYHETVRIYALAGFNDNFIDRAEDMWIWEWAYRYMNIEFVVEGIPMAAQGERAGPLFAGGDLPDVFFTFNPLASMANLTRFGDEEGQLRPLQDWITPDIMPNYYRVMSEVPSVFNVTRTAAGNIYGFARVFTDPATTMAHHSLAMWYNTEMLAAVGWDRPPRCLDEFLDVLRALRDANSDNPNFFPLAGGLQGLDFSHAIIQALGILAPGTRWQTAAIDHTTHPDFHYADFVALRGHEAHFYFIDFMRTLYAERLIHPDYFTKDTTAVQVGVAEGNAAFLMLNNTNTLMMVDDWTVWEPVGPMTSFRNPNRIWLVNNGLGDMTGRAFASSAIPDFELEAFLRFVDMHYHPRFGCVMHFGPEIGIDDTFDHVAGGWYWENGIFDGNRILLDVVNGIFPGNAAAANIIAPWAWEGNRADRRTSGDEIALLDPTNLQQYFHLMTVERLNPYSVFNIFGIVRPADEQSRFTDLHQLQYQLNNEALAGWVTGRDPFSRDIWEAHVEELRAVGLDEFQELLNLGQQRLRENRTFFMP